MKRTMKFPHRAAHDASKSLYNALRLGCDQIEKQTEQLKSARDQIRDIHIAQESRELDGTVQTVLDSCHSSLQIHISIFEAVLESITAHPGNKESLDLDSFSVLLSALRGATQDVDKCREFTKKQDARSDCVSSAESGSDAAPGVRNGIKVDLNEPEEQTPRKKRKIERDSKSNSVAPASTPVSVDAATVSDTIANVGKRKKSTASSKPKRNPNKDGDSHVDGIDLEDGELPAKESEYKKPVIPTPRRASVEDISGEVEARLQAKAEKRKKKKESKKRKRESIASSIFSPDPKQSLSQIEDRASGVPPKKKAKTNSKTLEKEAQKQSADRDEVVAANSASSILNHVNVSAKQEREADQLDAKKSNTSKRRHSATKEDPVQKEVGGHRKKRRMGF